MRSCPFLMESEIAARPLWKKVESPHEDYLLVGDEGIDAGAGRSSQTHSRQVVHQAGERGVLEHGVAADVSVEDEIGGRQPLPAHVARVGEVGGGLLEHAGRIAVRAARTEGRCSLRDRAGAAVQDLKLVELAPHAGSIQGKVAGVELGKEAGEALDGEGRMESHDVGKAGLPVGKMLAPEG